MSLRITKVPLAVAFFALFLGAAIGTPGPLRRAGGASPSPVIYDVVISNGRVMDPDSGLDAVRNVGVRGGIIRAVTAKPLAGRVLIDATGLVVAPGFLDLDAYPQNARFSVRDGVTTALDLRGGTADVARWYAEREGRMPINLGVGVSYPRVREGVMGAAGSLRRDSVSPASEAQLAQILRRITVALDDGAVSVGLGPSELLGPPTWELLETFRTAARVRAPVVATLRDAIWSRTDVPANLAEMIGLAALSGAAVHIPHLTSSGGPHTPRMLAMIARAREHGLDITAENYPYTAAIFRAPPGELSKRSDEELRELQWIATGEWLNRELAERYGDQEGFVMIRNSSIEPFVAEAVASPLTSVASHGSMTPEGRGHPRTSGTYSRVLGHYVREQKRLSLMEALRKMTLLPARRLEARVPGMRKKGRILEGADADITVFDADRVIDAATYQEPTRPPKGIRHVLVNGVVVVEDGVLRDGVYPGRALRAPVSPAK